MARPRVHNLHLPRGMYAKHGAYYVIRGGKWQRLGKTLQEALNSYADLFETATTSLTSAGAQRLQQVYVIGAKRLVKIGIATDLSARVRALRTSNPHLETVLYASEPIANARQVELEAHRALETHRVEGEWFRCARQLAIETVKRCENAIQIRQSNRHPKNS